MALIKCEECGKEISDKAAACPHCGCPIPQAQEESPSVDIAESAAEQPNEQPGPEKEKTPFYKTFWFWLIIVLVALWVRGAMVRQNARSTTAKAGTSKTAVTVSKEPDIPIGKANALKTAKSYLSHSAFSYDRLIEQLEYEGYTNEEAVYAVDNCGADWNEQAAKVAASYLKHSSFSKDGLKRQLEYEGFTSTQISYALKEVGY